MQAALTSSSARPFASSAKAPKAARGALVVRASSSGEAPLLQRRAALAALAAVLPAAAALPALALIPDDDDEDLVSAARANRANKLASEKNTEKAFGRSAGYTKTVQKDLIPVQKAVTALARAGGALEAGDARAAAAALRCVCVF